MRMQSVTTVASFEDLLKANKHVFVDFCANWCGPSLMISPHVENLSQTNRHIKFVKVNVQDGLELSRKYGVGPMPTFLGFTDGVKVAEVIGADVEGIERAISEMK